MSKTAFEEALIKASEGGYLDSSAYPSYLTEADTDNLLNENRTFLESAVDTIESIPKFIGASLISGANQLYNIAPDIGNLVAGEGTFERANTQEIISGMSEDFGDFYARNKTGTDLVGFIASSLIPGLGGVKLLNAGQKSLQTALAAGKLSPGMSRALGILAPQSAKFITAAKLEVAGNTSAASLLTANSLKALGSDFSQNVLEAVFFESAVAATMFNSPILEDQDFGDFVSNVAFSAGIFGVIGTAVSAAKLSYALKGAAAEASDAARPWAFIPEAAPVSNSYEKIALDFDTLANMPKPPAEFRDLARRTIETIENRVRKEFSIIANGDEAVADSLFNLLKRESAESQATVTRGLMEVGGYTSKPKTLAPISKIEAKINAGKPLSAKELEEYTTNTLHTTYAKAWGEGTNTSFLEAPVITQLVDTLKKGEVIKVDSNGVTAGAKKYNHHLKRVNGDADRFRPWNILEADTMAANSRYIWAAKLPPFSPTATKPIKIDVNDLPLMEKVYKDLGDSPELMAHVKFLGLAKGELPPSASNLFKYIGDKKVEVANKLLAARGERRITPTSEVNAAAEAATELKPKKTLVQEEIAAIVNVKSSVLSGEVTREAAQEFTAKEIFALQDHAETFTAAMVKKGARDAKAGTVDIWNVPQTMKMTYDSAPFAEVDNFLIQGITQIKEQQKLYQQSMDRVVVGVVGEEAFNALEPLTSSRIFTGAKPSGAGAGIITSADGSYGSLAATAANIGRNTTTIAKQMEKETVEALSPLLHKMGTKPEAAIEFSVLSQRTRAIEGEYGLNELGDALEPLALLRWRAAAKEAAAKGEKAPRQPRLREGMEVKIPIKHQETRDVVRAHIELNKARTNSLASIRTAQGVQFNRSPDAFYPIPVDPKEFPHFALVIDESITSGNQMKTIYATTAEELRAQTAKLSSNPQLRVLYKQDAENYYKARGEFSYEKTISDNYLDVEAHRKGVSAPYFAPTDPKKIVEDVLKWHGRRATGLAREAVAAKYEVQFNELINLGEQFTKAETSKYSNLSMAERVEDIIKNPYYDYIRTALGVSKKADYPILTQVNQMAEKAISGLMRKVATAVVNSKSNTDLAAVDAMMRQAGYKGAAYDAESELFANLTGGKEYLAATVQKANAALATIVLRWDAINSVNNAVSANVLLGTETKAVIRAIGRGDAEAAGALAGLTKIAIPGTDKTMFSASKMVGNSIKRFGTLDKSSAEYKFFESNGYLTTISKQYKDSLDNLTFKGNLSEWDKATNKVMDKLRSAGDKGEWITGNTLAEEFNRFVAADVMKQMTDVAVSRNLMTAKEQLTYINTFVNRTQGNYLASQRPLLFQGPIGQAIGLFQTYQFNLMQQLLRHVGEGHVKDSLTLLGLQGTIHGMNGMPAFNFVNTAILGNASGNTEHKDAFDAVYGTAGKEAGDWLMYGVGSNFLGLLNSDLKVNLYTRGDINPRQVTIVPTSLEAVPFIQASGKVLGNILDTAATIGAGGDVSTTLLQGLEHNGVSRPLAGFAQTMQGLNNPEQASYSTSSKGNVIAANDLVSVANLGRMLGAKPLDEAISLDAVYRYKAYAAKDAAKSEVLGKAIKSTVIAGGIPSQEQIEGFAESYAKLGGRQQEFSRWMLQLTKTANLSQANALKNNLNSPFSQSMQLLMGGEQLEDFTP